MVRAHPALLLFALLLAALTAGKVGAHPPAPQRFVAIALHDVVDNPAELDDDGVTSDQLVGFFEWLAGNGWTAISLDDIERARLGLQPLPPRAVLLTVDDGYRSLYTRVYPLALAYRTPVVAALVGDWMDTPAGDSVEYGQQRVPRSHFITWAKAREMQASGLIEFASHSQGLHALLPANPQGNLLPAAQTRQYAHGRYETDAQFRARIRADLVRARMRMQQELGRAPRALVWPYGRYNQAALEEASSLGFQFALTLARGPADAAQPLHISRFMPAGDKNLGLMIHDLRMAEPWPPARRLVEVDPQSFVGADAEATNQKLGQLIEQLVALGATHVLLDAVSLSNDGRVQSAWFPTSQVPVEQDLLSRFSAQMSARAGVQIVARLPHAAALATLGDPRRVLALYADLASHVPFDALLLEDMQAPGLYPARPDEAPWDVRERRDAIAQLEGVGGDVLALQAFRLAERARPGLELFWLAPDTAAQPPASGIAELTLVARRLEAESRSPAFVLDAPLSRRTGILWSADSAAAPVHFVQAIRAFQAQGGTVFGWQAAYPHSGLPPLSIAPEFSARDSLAPGYAP